MDTRILANLLAEVSDISKSVSELGSPQSEMFIATTPANGGARAICNFPGMALQLDTTAKYRIDVLSFTLVANMKNVNTNNNVLYYTTTGDSVNHTLTIPPGRYEFENIFALISAAIPGLQFSINMNTYKTHVVIPAGIVIRNDPALAYNIMRLMFGFTQATLTFGPSTTADSERTPVISTVNNYLFRCNRCSRGAIITKNGVPSRRTNTICPIYSGGLRNNSLNTFEKGSNDLYFALDNVATLSNIEFYVTDENSDDDLTDDIELTVYFRICKASGGSGKDNLS